MHRKIISELNAILIIYYFASNFHAYSIKIGHTIIVAQYNCQIHIELSYNQKHCEPITCNFDVCKIYIFYTFSFIFVLDVNNIKISMNEPLSCSNHSSSQIGINPTKMINFIKSTLLY